MSIVVVFGCGFLGNRLAGAIPGARLVPTDICDRAGVLDVLRHLGADVVINTAGKTGRPNIDYCQTHQEETYRSNVIGALTLASACAEAGAYLIHLGSGCIFCGPSPSQGGWLESDPPNPGSYYAKTKSAADLCLGDLDNVAVVRIRMPIDSAPHPRNLISKLAAYPQVIGNVVNSVTVVDDLIEVIKGLIEKRPSGIFHATNPGTVRHRDILKLYKEVVDPLHNYELIDEEELLERGLVKAPRSNCVLQSTRLEECGIHMRPIAVALPEVMKAYRDAGKMAAYRDAVKK